MSNAVTLSADDQRTLETLLASLPDPQSLASLPDCNTYKNYRSILQTALPFVKKIPVYGDKIYTALTFLMSMADGICNISPAPAPPSPSTTDDNKINVQKISQTEVLVRFPEGTEIKPDTVSEVDLYAALSRSLFAVKSGPRTPDCVLVVGPICTID